MTTQQDVINDVWFLFELAYEQISPEKCGESDQIEQAKNNIITALEGSVWQPASKGLPDNNCGCWVYCPYDNEVRELYFYKTSGWWVTNDDDFYCWANDIESASHYIIKKKPTPPQQTLKGGN